METGLRDEIPSNLLTINNDDLAKAIATADVGKLQPPPDNFNGQRCRSLNETTALRSCFSRRVQLHESEDSQKMTYDD